MGLSMNADVHCTDGKCGKSVCIIINPVTQQVTHFAVQEKKAPHTVRLVEVDRISATSHDGIWLDCTRGQLSAMDAFIETDFVRGSSAPHKAKPFLMWPSATPQSKITIAEHERIPPGELSVRRGAKVVATDGDVGQIDEFLVDTTDAHITHLVLRKGHLLFQKDAVIPVSQIDHIEKNAIYLKLDKKHVALLPTIPVHRRYVWEHHPKTEPVSQDKENTERGKTIPIESLIADLGSNDWRVRTHGRQSLVNRGSVAVEPLMAALENTNPSIRWEAAKSLIEIGRPAATPAVPALVKTLNDADFGVRWLAAEGLIVIGRDGLAPLLRTLMLHSDSIRLRNGAHHVLRLLATDEADAPVISVLAALDSLNPGTEVPFVARAALNMLTGTAD